MDLLQYRLMRERKDCTVAILKLIFSNNLGLIVLRV